MGEAEFFFDRLLRKQDCLHSEIILVCDLILSACRSQTPEALSSKQLPYRDLIAEIH
jgi:hypothetical protein